MTRIAVCPDLREADVPSIQMLEDEGHQVVRCPHAAGLLECMAAQAPGVVVYFLDPHDPEGDFALLRLVRRTAPQLLLILVASKGSLHLQALTQALRPVYYTVAPLDRIELSEAVRAAEHRNAGGTRATEEEAQPRARGAHRAGRARRAP